MRHTQLFAYLLLLAAKECHCVLFRHLYPDSIDKIGHPTGLNVSNNKLTTYNGTQNTPLWITSSAPSSGSLVPPVHNPHQDLIRKFPDRFQGRGQFTGEYTIRLCDNAQPVIYTPQKCPISIHPKVKAELEKMAKLGVITPVDEPTDCVSSVGYAWKASGELCICLDPCDLNNTIHRDHHCTPTVDKVAHEFAHSRYFTELDARHGYWAVMLDSKSSFNTPMVDNASYISPLV